MGTPLGDFVRAKRDSIQPDALGMPDHGRRRSPGLRRTDLAARAGISVEYLTRIEQGRDRRPSPAVLNALADALSLSTEERAHIRYLAKITGGECRNQPGPAPASRQIRESVRETLRLLEPGIAMIANRLGDVLARTAGFDRVMSASGLLDGESPNLTRYVFTDPRARDFFADWAAVADEQAFDLWLAPAAANSRWFTEELAPLAGTEFTSRVNRHLMPARDVLRLNHPAGPRLTFRRETLELPTDAQQIVVYLAADEQTDRALTELRAQPTLRAV